MEGLSFSARFKLSNIKLYSYYSILNDVFRALALIQHGS